MANLTVKQKNDIKELKSLISKSVFTVAKIQDTTIVEQELLQQAMNYIAIDRVGDYHGRMNELNKYRYMIDGILYNHLDSKQINFGYPKSISIPAPVNLANPYEESFGSGIFSDIDEPI